MNWEFFIANRIALGAKRSFSRFIVRIALIAVALSMLVMIIATATVTGFQKIISEKIYGFWGHIQITHFDANRSFEGIAVSTRQDFYPHLDTIPGIRHIQVFATKAGIMKTKENIEGIVLKGIGNDFDWATFSPFMIEGDAIRTNDSTPSKDILISKTTAKRLQLAVGDDIAIYFIQKRTRARKFKITGIYNTGLEEYDKLYALVDIGQIRRLNSWTGEQAGGFEVFIEDIAQLDQWGERIYYSLIGPELYAQTIYEMYPNIFDWLRLQDLNEFVILFLMLLVAGINMITALLILILERTNMVGILKALGATDWSVRKIFLYNAGYIISVGLFWGNFLGIGLCLLQQHFGLVTLPEESYYIPVAPINLDWGTIVGLNIGTLGACLLMLIIPSVLVTRINPIKAIRFS